MHWSGVPLLKEFIGIWLDKQSKQKHFKGIFHKTQLGFFLSYSVEGLYIKIPTCDIGLIYAFLLCIHQNNLK